MASKEEQILDLKRRAIALKDAGDTNAAMVLLAEARDVEFEDARVEDIWEPVKLKQLAVVFKKKGDLGSAKQALLKAKKIEKEGVQMVQQQQQQQQPSPENVQPPEPEKHEAKTDSTSPGSQEDNQRHDTKAAEIKEPIVQDAPIVDAPVVEPGADGCDADEWKELMQLDETKEEDLLLDVSFTIEEMSDLEMVTEFKLCGMPVPTDEEYQAKVLQCKKSALVCKKAGDTTKALQELQKSKQLEKVRVALSKVANDEGLGSQDNDEDEDAWMEGLNDEESELLGELSTKKPVISTETQQTPTSNKGDLIDTLEELADFMDDPALLMDAIDMGMEIPSVEEVRTKAAEQKQTAIANKKAGNLEGAKAALLKSKQLTVHASKLEATLAQTQTKNGNGTDANNVNMEDLEALVEAEEKATKPVSAAHKKELEKASPSAVKSSADLKQEAIGLRDQKKIKEAAAVLKLYKEALKREQQEAELKQRQKIIKEIQQEIEYAQRQVRIFEFYEKFVDFDSQQVSMWKEYIAKCSNVSKIIQVKGSKAVKIARKQGNLMCAKQNGQDGEDMNAMIKSLVEMRSNSDPTDERLEISILDVQKLQDNSTLQKLLKRQKRENLPQHPSTIRVEVHIQLPPNEEETDKSIELVYDPAEDPLKKLELATEGEETAQLPSSCDIQSSQYVELVRGSSAFGKIIRRRIERNKKIQITAYSVPIAPKKGWFWSKKGKGDEELPPPTLLGKVVLELQELLNKKCIAAGEFPFMNGSGSKALGGTIRLAVRTGVPLEEPGLKTDETAIDTEGEDTHAEVVPYDVMAFSLNNQPTPKAGQKFDQVQ